MMMAFAVLVVPGPEEMKRCDYDADDDYHDDGRGLCDNEKCKPTSWDSDDLGGYSEKYEQMIIQIMGGSDCWWWLLRWWRLYVF